MTFRRSLSAAAVGLLAGGSLLVLTSARAEAQILPPQPAPITDYANYPANNELPPGCDANGVVGVTFTANGGPAVSNLQDLGALSAGDLVVMSWTDVLPVCGDGPNLAPIVLALKSTEDGFFDPTDDQLLKLPYGLGFMEVGQPGSVPFVLPPLADEEPPGCFAQLDAITGLPLADVGPGGSFYNYGVPWDMLISSWNGGYENCVAQETTTTTGSTTSTTEGTTTTTQASTTTTEPATTTEPPATTVPPSSTTAAPTSEPSVLTPAKVEAAQATRTLAQTGRLSGPAALVGFLALGFGVSLLVATAVGRRLRRLGG